LRAELPRILAAPANVLSPRMMRMIEELALDWRRLDERIEGLSNEIEALARRDAGCEHLMSVPGIGPIISSAMVAAIGSGDAFTKGRDFPQCPFHDPLPPMFVHEEGFWEGSTSESLRSPNCPGSRTMTISLTAWRRANAS
jgi:hypothetical protein